MFHRPKQGLKPLSRGKAPADEAARKFKGVLVVSKVVSRIVCHGYRTVMGTDFPVESYLEKSPRKPGELPGGPWLVTIRLCNGTAEGGRRFRTKREAMAFLDRL